MKEPTITVIGSMNMDMVTITDDVPAQGETVLGKMYDTHAGGKGANQAVAAARLGANVQMIGMVGEDQYGSDLLNNLENEGVSTHMIQAVSHTHTGVANVILSNQDNRIIIIPGANNEVTPDYIKQFKQEILKSDLVLIQFEIPIETVLYCLDLCEANHIPIIVNPAPAQDIPNEYWEKATYITPNESEATQLFSKNDIESHLSDKIIVTKGEHGVSYYENGGQLTVPAYIVTPIDTTGAGDTFNGALSVALAEQKDLEEAIKFANAASALSVQKLGAQEGMPTRDEVKGFLAKRCRRNK